MKFWELATCWNYFLSIEKDLSETSQYIEPYGQENTYSFEFYKIIMLSCAEIETAFKQLCNLIEPQNKCGKINEYKEVILSKYPKICDCMVVVPRWKARNLFPFKGWDTGKLTWWSAYQDLKHSRFTKISEATYQNAVSALAALYILILYLYKISGYDCKADDSVYFWSEYHPAQHYLPPISELPDFADVEKKKDEINEHI